VGTLMNLTVLRITVYGPIPRPKGPNKCLQTRFRNAGQSPCTALAGSAMKIDKQRDATYVQHTVTE
jgi:hypothetical protein